MLLENIQTNSGYDFVRENNGRANNLMGVRARTASLLLCCLFTVQLLTKSENLGINVKVRFYEIHFRYNQHYYRQGLCSVRAEDKSSFVKSQV